MADKYRIIKAQDPGKGWYILTLKGVIAVFLQKDLTFHMVTGWSESNKQYGEAPGYYHSAEEAKQYLDVYLYIENLRKSVTIKEWFSWFVFIQGKYLWADLTLHRLTFNSGTVENAPGYYPSKKQAECVFEQYLESEKQKQLNKIKGTEMRKLEVGDKIDITDGSYVFGIQGGVYKTHCNHENGDRENLIVIKTGLSVTGDAFGRTSGEYSQVCDLLVTDNKDGFWFTQSKLVKLATHTITIDGEEIEISAQSYENLRKSLR